VVHRFHPWFGRDLEFVKRRRNWRADPFVVVAAGRAPFRTADPLKLADEVARLRSGAAGVQEILP
jgi:hypothetical protein